MSEFAAGHSELSLPFGSGGFFSPSHHSISDSDCESEAAASSFAVRRHCFQVITNPERLEKVAEFSERLTPPLTQVHSIPNPRNATFSI
jgi:hypothetical protein